MEAPAQRHPLAAVRAARGWSYQELVEAVAARSRLLGVPMAARREKAWRWENWGVVPDADSQRALALALGVSPARMAVRPWPGWLPTGTELPTDLAWTPAGSLTALQQLLDDIDEDRRGFAIATPAVLADALAAWEPSNPEVAAMTAAHGCQHPDNVDDGIAVWLRTHALTLPPLLRAVVGADPAVVRRKLDGDLRLITELLTLSTLDVPRADVAGTDPRRAGRIGDTLPGTDTRSIGTGTDGTRTDGTRIAGTGSTGTGASTGAGTAVTPAPARPTAGTASPPRPRPDLFQAAAKIALLAGRHSLRANLHGPAQRYLLTALRCTHSAADPAAAAATLAILGRHLATLGDATTGRRFRALAASVRGRERSGRVAGVAA